MVYMLVTRSYRRTFPITKSGDYLNRESTIATRSQIDNNIVIAVSV